MKKTQAQRYIWGDDEIQFQAPTAHADWHPDQPRDENGRFSGEGGGASAASVRPATVAVPKLGGKGYKHAAEAERAAAGQGAAAKAYEAQMAEQKLKDGPRGPSGMPRAEYERRLAAGERQGEIARNQSEVRLGLDPRPIATGEDLRSSYPEPREPGTLPGQGSLYTGTVGMMQEGRQAGQFAEIERNAEQQKIAEAIKEHKGWGPQFGTPNGQYGTETAEKMMGSKNVELLKTPSPESSNHHSGGGDWDESESGMNKTKPEMATSVMGKDFPQNPTAERHGFAADREELAKHEIVSAKVNGNDSTGNSSASWKVTLDDGSKAIWKPESGESANVRDHIDKGEGYIREAAASAVAEQLGVGDMAPGTVIHEHTDRNGTEKGALQSYMTGNSLQYSGVVFDREAGEKMRVFDYVTGNTDRHSGNVLWKEDEKGVDALAGQRGKTMPVLIDHGLTFPHGNTDRFIQPWKNIDHTPGPLLPGTQAQIAKIDVPKLAQSLHSNGIDKESIRYTVMRAMHLQGHPDVLEIHPGDSQSMYHWDNLMHEDLDDEHGKAADKIMKGLK